MKNKSFVKEVSVLLVLTLMLSSVGALAANTVAQTTTNRVVPGKTLYVGGSGPGNYSSIQSAISAAAPRGDTVFVYDDSSPYYEHIVVDKSINLIGENRDTTIIEGRQAENIKLVHIENSGVRISGFTIIQTIIPTSGYGAGLIHVSPGYSGNTITGNTIICAEGDDGIYLNSSNGNTIIGNTITNPGGGCGIDLDGSSNNIVTGNAITCSDYCGIQVYASSNNNIITGNTVIGAGKDWLSGWGIWLCFSSGNIVGGKDPQQKNIIKNYHVGIWIFGGCIYFRGTLQKNNIFDNNSINILGGLPGYDQSSSSSSSSSSSFSSLSSSSSSSSQPVVTTPASTPTSTTTATTSTSTAIATTTTTTSTATTSKTNYQQIITN